jgi:translocation and assembly module TamA
MRQVFQVFLIGIFFGNFAYGMCEGIIVHSDPKIKFTETEKNLVCGDPKSESYKVVPHYQAQFYFLGFLQSRGYLKPTFEEKNGVLEVSANRRSFLRKVFADIPIQKEGTALKKNTRKLFRKKLLTPNLLNDAETEGLSLLRQRGFPCSSVKSQANSEDDSITLITPTLKFERFGVVDKEEIKPLRENALERYYPFHAEDPFNEKLLKLTEKRMLRAEVVQGTYFLDNCMSPEETFKLRQEFIEGPPRTFRYGFGASTELGPMVRVQWAHNRYEKMASVLKASFLASLRSQTLSLTADNFLWKHHPRKSLLSAFNISTKNSW